MRNKNLMVKKFKKVVCFAQVYFEDLPKIVDVEYL